MFRDHFERELEQVWSRLARVADTFPRVAPELARDAHPSMTRLAQAAAYFLAAVRSRLDDDMPELGHPLVAQALPGALTGMPSATIVQMHRRRADGGAFVDAGARVIQRSKGPRPVSFTTRWPTYLPPCTVAEARVERRSGDETIVELELQLLARGTDPPGTRLRLHFDLGDATASADLVHDLLECARPTSVAVIGARGETLREITIPAGRLRRSVWSEPEPLVPGRPEAFPSSTLLRSWYCFPALFCFVDLELGDTFWRSVPAESQRLRLTLELAKGAQAPSAFDAAHVRVGCTPAINAYDAVTPTIPLDRSAQRVAIELSGREDERPWVLDVLRVRGEPRGEGSAPRVVPSWEDADSDRPLRDGFVSYRLHRQARATGDEPLFELSFASTARFSVAPPYVSVVVDTLAYDGVRAGGLLPGELLRAGGPIEARNVTATSRAFPPLFDREIPWRLNAYARAPIDRIARAEPVAAFLALHDVPRMHLERRVGALHLRHPGVREVVHQRARRLDRGELQHGDDLTVAIATLAFGSRGTASVLGELLARAFAERASALRFTRSRVVGEGFLFEGGDRAGARLPAPFG